MNEPERNEFAANMQWLKSEFEPGLVSVVIPTYRRSELLKSTIMSFFRQTYRPLEIIVVEDGPTRETESAAASMKNDCPDGVRFLFDQQPNQGAPTARNLGAQKCSGEYILFTDDDDIAAKDFIEQRVLAIEKQDANVAYGPWRAFRLVDGTYRLFALRDSEPLKDMRQVWPEFLQGWSPLLQSFLLRRNVVDAVGPWDVDLLKGQDLDYKAKVFSQEFKFAHANAGCMYYREHFDSISKHRRPSQVASIVQSVKTVERLTMERADCGDNLTILANYLWYFAFRLFSRNAVTEGLELMKLASKHDPDLLLRQTWLTRILVNSNLGRLLGHAYFVRKRLGQHVAKLTGRWNSGAYQSCTHLPS